MLRSCALRSCALPSSVRIAFALACVIGVTNCGGSTPTDPDPDPATISISIDPSSGTVEQGGALVVTGTATIGGGFSGGVTFTITGLPAGVTISVGTVTQSGNSATAPITVTVGAGVAAGTYEGTVTASGSNVSDSVTYSLTVTAATGFSLESISDISIQQGQSGSREVAIVRAGGFAESVALAVEGAPSGLTATPDPASTSGTTSTVGIDVGAAVAPGSYTLTVRGTATGFPDATVAFAVTVTAAPAGTAITVDFSVCAMEDRPVWVAFQDGSGGTWTRVTPVGDSYTFNVTADDLGLATVYVSGSQNDVSVDYFTTPEAVEAAAGDVCQDSAPTGKSIDGTVTGVVGLTNLTLGGVSSFVIADGPFSIVAVPDGVLDFVGYSANAGGGSDRMLILRDQEIADNGNIGTIDFTADGFDPESATITVDGLVGGESGGVSTEYATISAGSACSAAPLSTELLAGSFTLSSAPASERASDEYHVAGASIVVGDVTKTVKEAFQTLADRTLTLPPAMPEPTLTDVTDGAGYLRLQAAFDAPADFNSWTFFDYYSGSSNTTLFASAGFMSGSVTLAMPDFSAVDGWDDAWAVPAAATGVEYVLWGNGQTTANPLCSDGGRVVNSARGGAYN